MELHNPAAPVVFPSHKKHEGGLEGQLFFPGKRRAAEAFLEDILDRFLGGWIVHHIFQTVVGNTAAPGGKEIHAVFQNIL